jgi:hypothetical protein
LAPETLSAAIPFQYSHSSLTAELETAQTAVTQRETQQRLGFGLLLTQFSGVRGGFRQLTWWQCFLSSSPQHVLRSAFGGLEDPPLQHVAGRGGLRCRRSRVPRCRSAAGFCDTSCRSRSSCLKNRARRAAHDVDLDLLGADWDATLRLIAGDLLADMR